MLSLVNINKDYGSGEQTVHALKNVSIHFRENEFVSILGQSGCGKTTMLNIIGGLDRYTDGDLIVGGISTKKYKAKDWDTYRNHSVGFVFQSYNLIMHLSVLRNVELALTLSGISKSERKKMAETALEKVGLKDQIHKKPNQLSGGQMQRVAIARALVNNPDIILADEPTGALDTETSIQVMELLKEVANDKLVVMVTHNPSLAQQYSTRIIKLSDGEVTDDSNPFEYAAETSDENKVEDKKEFKKKKKANKKKSMSFLTALSLSFRNLNTKKARTILTSFAGSIGIIGIALILSLSSGFQTYITAMEEETLSAYPLQIDKLAMENEMSVFFSDNSETEEKTEFPDDKKVYKKDVLDSIINSYAEGVTVNDMKSFKKYIEDNGNKFDDLINSVQYKYGNQFNVYSSEYDENSNTINNPIDFDSTSEVTHGSVNMMMGQTAVWSELIDNRKLLESQYDVLEGSWPKDKNEVVIVVDKYNRIDDYVLYSLGLRSIDDYNKSVNAIVSGNKDDIPNQASEFTFNELLNKTYKLVLSDDYYQKQNGVWINKSNDTKYMKNILDKSLDLKVSGIIRIKDGVTATAFESGGIGYTSDLTKYIVESVNESEIVKEQMSSPDINIFTGEKFSAQESFENNLNTLGVSDLDEPSSILFYAKGFDEKEALVEILDEYNASRKTDSEKIQYTDYVGLMMSSITTIINSISYVLIAFVTISLIVSSIMIGIITYISVLERTKEIGILRSIGASKRDISRVFNAETLIVGFTSGIIGIAVTVLLDIPITMIIKSLTDLDIVAMLPLGGGIILVIISMLLTLIAGLIPSRMAAKRDPVVALRSE